MKQVKLTRIARFTTNKDGEPLVNKSGKPYERVNIQCEEQSDEWISGFGNDENKGWKVGDEVTIEITRNGQYWNFKMPNKTSELETRVTICENSISSLQSRLNTLEGKEIQEELNEEAGGGGDINLDDVSF